jgi:hypothetical protein
LVNRDNSQRLVVGKPESDLQGSDAIIKRFHVCIEVVEDGNELLPMFLAVAFFSPLVFNMAPNHPGIKSCIACFTFCAHDDYIPIWNFVQIEVIRAIPRTWRTDVCRQPRPAYGMPPQKANADRLRIKRL